MTSPTHPGDLPEELVAEAREIATAWCAHIFVDSATEFIARSLMAARKDERERAARIAFSFTGHANQSEHASDVARAIAAAILSDKEQSHAE